MSSLLAKDSKMGKLLVVLGIGLCVFIARALKGFFEDKAPPTLPDFYWGETAKQHKKQDTSIRPFEINISDNVLNDLKVRLQLETNSSRLTPPFEGIGFQYGFNSKALLPITTYWLVIPSLPGFGFSEAGHMPGLGHVEMAQVFQKLMERLGYKQYYIQGGDWGSFIATNLAVLYLQYVTVLHLNFSWGRHRRIIPRILLGAIYPQFILEEKEISKLFPLFNFDSYLIEETGYFNIQATKPDTPGDALSNSPSGLAVWILEKFSTLTNPDNRKLEDGGLLQNFSIDDLLDNIMIYWVTNSMTTAMRFYAEEFSQKTICYSIDNVPAYVPTGCLSLPHEIASFYNEVLLQDKYPQLVSFTRVDKGGHFAAFEIPAIFAQDVIRFASIVEKMTKTNSN